MSEDDIGPSVSTSPVGLVTQSPLAFALILVGLYWAVKVLRPSDTSRPPRVPYWIPWLGSALEMGKDPDGFFSSMTCVFQFFSEYRLRPNVVTGDFSGLFSG